MFRYRDNLSLPPSLATNRREYLRCGCDVNSHQHHVSAGGCGRCVEHCRCEWPSLAEYLAGARVVRS